VHQYKMTDRYLVGMFLLDIELALLLLQYQQRIPQVRQYILNHQVLQIDLQDILRVLVHIRRLVEYLIWYHL